MYIHLEAGTCSSGADREKINSWAFECYDFDAYSTYRRDGYYWKCPGCGKKFRRISALFQHAESDACTADINEYPLGDLDEHIYQCV